MPKRKTSGYLTLIALATFSLPVTSSAEDGGTDYAIRSRIYSWIGSRGRCKFEEGQDFVFRTLFPQLWEELQRVDSKYADYALREENNALTIGELEDYTSNNTIEFFKVTAAPVVISWHLDSEKLEKEPIIRSCEHDGFMIDEKNSQVYGYCQGYAYVAFANRSMFGEQLYAETMLSVELSKFIKHSKNKGTLDNLTHISQVRR